MRGDPRRTCQPEASFQDVAVERENLVTSKRCEGSSHRRNIPRRSPPGPATDQVISLESCTGTGWAYPLAVIAVIQMRNHGDRVCEPLCLISNRVETPNRHLGAEE
jgi:hypothetical protein